MGSLLINLLQPTGYGMHQLVEYFNKCMLCPCCIYVFCVCLRTNSGPGSSVGIGTDYGLDGPGIESRWGRDFSHTSRPALGSTQPPVQWVWGLPRG
jgi:hypothetical protein